MLTTRRIAVVAVMAVSILAAAAAPALAHVTISAPGATQGGDAVLTFQVPTESDTLSTVALKVQLPTDHPIASVSVQSIPGWTIKTVTTKLASPIKTDDGEVTEAVSEIDWTADNAAAAIKPGQFGQFPVSAGPLPDVDVLTFKAIQTYSDHSQVAWIEETAPGSTAEPDHPAPTVSLAPAAPQSSTPAAGATGHGSNTGAVILSIVALVVAAAALALAFVRRGAARD